MEISAYTHAQFASMGQPRDPLPSPRAASIALILHTLGGGGAQRRVATLANGFAKSGRRVDVVTFESRGPAAAILDPAVRIVELTSSKPLKGVLTVAYAPALARYFDEMRPDLAMSAATNTHSLTVAAAAFANRKTPIVLRASRHPLRPIGWRQPLRHLAEGVRRRVAAESYRRANAIVAVSQGVASGLKTLIGYSSTVATILNPVIPSNFSTAQDPAPDIAEPLIVGIGRFVRQKDFPTLLEAFTLIRRSRAAKLVLLGKGPDRAKLVAQSDKLGIAADLILPGEVDNVPSWLGRASMLVSTSLWEGLPATLIEALAAGCPVVATDCPGGSREILDHGRYGTLVPMQQPQLLADAMQAMLDTPPDREHLKEGATPYIEGSQTLRYLELFDRCVAETSPAEVPARLDLHQAAE